MISRKKKLRIMAGLSATLLYGTIMPVVSADVIEDDEFKASKTLEVINARTAYEKGFSGNGTVIAISDYLVNFENPEFNDQEPYYLSLKPDNYDWSRFSHGTHVAGLAAAARNGTGMQGVAYNAYIASMGMRVVPPASSGIKIMNNSYNTLIFPMDSDDVADSNLTIKELYERYSYGYDAFYHALNEADVLSFRANGNMGHLSGDLERLLPYLYGNKYYNEINVTNLKEYYESDNADDFPSPNGMRRVEETDGKAAVEGTVILDIASNLAMFA